MPVESFHCQIQAETLPPTLDWLEAQIIQQLPPRAELLQWAIVSTEASLMKIEGSLVLK